MSICRSLPAVFLVQSGHSFSCFCKGRPDCGEGQQQREWRIKKRHGPVAGVPAGRQHALGIDQQANAANLCRRQQAAPPGCEEKLATKSPALHRQGDGEPRQAERRHLVAGEAALNELRRPVVGDRRRISRYRSRGSFGRSVLSIARKVLAPPPLVALARVLAQKGVQGVIAAVEVAPVVRLCDRLLMPRRKAHEGPGNARAAASSLALGAGGFSSSSRTRRVSRSDS